MMVRDIMVMGQFAWEIRFLRANRFISDLLGSGDHTSLFAKGHSIAPALNDALILEWYSE